MTLLLSCGTVISDRIAETRPEWSVIGVNELYSGSKTGMPMSLAVHDLGLSIVSGENLRLRR